MFFFQSESTEWMVHCMSTEINYLSLEDVTGTLYNTARVHQRPHYARQSATDSTGQTLRAQKGLVPLHCY